MKARFTDYLDHRTELYGFGIAVNNKPCTVMQPNCLAAFDGYVGFVFVALLLFLRDSVDKIG